MGHLAALPSPSLARACGRAGAGKRGSRLPGGVGRGGDGHGRACGCRMEGRAGSRSRQFDSPQTFSVSAWLAVAGGAGAGCSLLPVLVTKSLPRASGPPRRGPRGVAACPVRAAGRRLRALPRPRGCAAGAQGRALGSPPCPPGLCSLLDRRPFPLDLTLGVTKAPFYFQCHFGVCLLFPATSRFQGYGRLPADSGKG